MLSVFKFLKPVLIACIPIPIIVFIVVSFDGNFGHAFGFALIALIILTVPVIVFGIPTYFMLRYKELISYKPFLILGILIPWIGMLIDATFNSDVFWFEIKMYLFWGAVGGLVSMMLWQNLSKMHKKEFN